MSLYLTPEDKEEGQKCFHQTVGELGQHSLTRRDFMQGLLVAGSVLPIATGAYFGYQLLGKPVRAGLIGAGDQGGVLVGEHNPDYLQFVAYSDLRPSNCARIMAGEPHGPRKGFQRIYGRAAADAIDYHFNYKDLLARKDIEAVIIALPLHLHAPVAVEALRAGKHVLCEKLMAWNVSQCKEMIRTADAAQRILAIGHQRHYSLLYAQAVEVVQSGVLGGVHHIRALWHRNNTWPWLDNGQPVLDKKGKAVLGDSWHPSIPPKDRAKLEANIRQLGYKSMEELVRWRLYQRTGGGLMAELGSHQLDACSIFLGKVRPLAVYGVGGKLFYRDEREVDDHVFVTFEFPGKNYYERDREGTPLLQHIKDRDDHVVVTYSAINTNNFEPYGECLLGTRGTLLIEQEASAMLFPQPNPSKQKPGNATSVIISGNGNGKPVIDSSSTCKAGKQALDPVQAQAIGKASIHPVSRGYREEMEHFVYCVRMCEQAKDAEERKKWLLTPRCHGRIALADAVIALTANIAMKRHERLVFQPEWFDAYSEKVPDAEMRPEIIR